MTKGISGSCLSVIPLIEVSEKTLQGALILFKQNAF